MKKILALLMMFLISGNFLFAQVGGTEGDATVTASVQPRLNFQAVVRDAQNHLVFDNEMDVVININYVNEGGENATYSEKHKDVKTNKHGLLTVIIGGDDAINVDGSLYDVDWSAATIEAVLTFTPNPTLNPDGTTTMYDRTTVTVTSDVTAVPYALQAGSTRLNTDMIVNYISGIKLGENGTPDQKRDVLLILDAIRNNTHGLKNALKDTIVEYMKTRMDIAKEVFQYYLSHATVEDVQNTYDEVTLNPQAHQAILEVIKQFIRNHEADAIDIAKYYVEHVTASQLVPLYNSFRANSALEAQAKVLVKHYLKEYLDDNYYVSIDGCRSVEICAIANQNKPCPSGITVGATTLVDNKLQTTINNPNDHSVGVTYENVTYELGGETVPVPDSELPFDGHKDGSNLIKDDYVFPEGATNPHGTIIVNVYGCEDITETF